MTTEALAIAYKTGETPMRGDRIRLRLGDQHVFTTVTGFHDRGSMLIVDPSGIAQWPDEGAQVAYAENYSLVMRRPTPTR